MILLKDIIAVLLAGGKGTRLNRAGESLPKPLVCVGKYNLLEHNLFYLKRAGVKKIIISVGYGGDLIRNYFEDGKRYDLEINYVQDLLPLGDGGALRQCYLGLTEKVIVANADEIRVGLDLEAMLKFHLKVGALATASLIEQEDPAAHGIMEVNSERRITKFMMNPVKGQTTSCYANSGLYFFEPEVVRHFPEGHTLMKDIIPLLIATNQIYGFVYEGTYFNVGTSSILDRARIFFEQQNSTNL